jgi:hypothetical protein
MSKRSDMEEKKEDSAEEARSFPINVPELSLEEKRLVSLAEVLELDSVCVAIARINGDVYVATNSTKPPKLFNEVQEFLVETVNTLKSKKESLNNNKKDFNNKICASVREGNQDKKQELIAKQDKIFNENNKVTVSSPARFKRALDNIEKVLIKSFQTLRRNQWPRKKTFNEKFISALTKPMIFVENLTSHAEMSIISKLLEENILQNTATEIYIAISKKCCLACEVTIKAINQYFNQVKQENSNNATMQRQKECGDECKEQITERPKASHYGNNRSRIILREDAGHRVLYPSPMPEFLTETSNLLNASDRNAIKQIMLIEANNILPKPIGSIDDLYKGAITDLKANLRRQQSEESTADETKRQERENSNKKSMADKKEGLEKREQTKFKEKKSTEKKFDLYGDRVGKSSPPIYKNPNVASYTERTDAEKTQASNSVLPFVKQKRTNGR